MFLNKKISTSISILLIVILAFTLGLIVWQFSFFKSSFNLSQNQVDFEEVERQEVIDYLEKSVLTANFGGEIFADYYQFGKKDSKIFIWAYIAEYYKKDNELKLGSGYSGPMIITITEDGFSYWEPRSGSLFSESIKANFPQKYHDSVLKFHTKHKKILDNLIQSVKEKAKEQMQEKSDDEQSYEVPEKLNTKYISIREWEAEAKTKKQASSGLAITERGVKCKEGADSNSLIKKTTKIIEGREYCVKLRSEGAAGSIYKEYSYFTIKNNNFVRISFVLQYSQCENYSDPKRTECKNEREALNLDKIIQDVVEDISS